MNCLKVVNEKLIPLNIDEKQYFRKFFKELKYNKVELIYRGISIYDICDKLLISELSDKKYIEIELANKLFMLGEKSNYFLQKVSDIQKGDISNKAFEKIFDMLQSKDWSNIDYFIEQEEEFFKFFSSEKNKVRFIEAINKINNKKDKLLIINYYLILLHQLNYLKYKERSFHVSTSKDFNQAKQFINKCGIILYCWKIKNTQSIKKYDGIPICKNLPFENEKENTEYLGLFPHFIYGFKMIDDRNDKNDKNKFIFNLHMFTKYNINRAIKTVVQFGIFIDQSNFEEVLHKTKYKNSFQNSDLE